MDLNCHKACGPDLLPSCLLKLGTEFIAPSLAHLFQLSISSGKLPLDWVGVNVVPVHKKGDKHLVNNYYPISLTTMVIRRELFIISWSGHLRVISNCQFGFCSKHSTTSLLLHTVHN